MPQLFWKCYAIVQRNTWTSWITSIGPSSLVHLFTSSCSHRGKNRGMTLGDYLSGMRGKERKECKRFLKYVVVRTSSLSSLSSLPPDSWVMSKSMFVAFAKLSISRPFLLLLLLLLLLPLLLQLMIRLLILLLLASPILPLTILLLRMTMKTAPILMGVWTKEPSLNACAESPQRDLSLLGQWKIL